MTRCATVQPVAQQVAARPFDDARRYGVSCSQSVALAQVGSALLQLPGANVDRVAQGQPLSCGRASDSGCFFYFFYVGLDRLGHVQFSVPFERALVWPIPGDPIVTLVESAPQGAIARGFDGQGRLVWERQLGLKLDQVSPNPSGGFFGRNPVRKAGCRARWCQSLRDDLVVFDKNGRELSRVDLPRKAASASTATLKRIERPMPKASLPNAEEKARIAPGDVVLASGKPPLESPVAVRAAVEAAGAVPLVLSLERQGKPVKVRVTPAVTGGGPPRIGISFACHRELAQ